MSKAKGFLLLAAATVFLLSCSEDLKPIERQTLEDLETLQSSSSSGEGTNFSSSSEVENLSSSNEAANLSSSGEAASSSSSGEAASSSSSGEAANPSSSSEAANPSSSGEEQKPAVSGVSQKGPFLNNSSVTLYELGSDLVQTGRVFQGMTDNKGSFEIKGIELASPYALLKADGFYRNEVTGGNSSAPITLYAIADMSNRSSANVNILTHLEYYRVQTLVQRGKSLAAAKKQALGEILAVFSIDGSGFKGSEDMSIFGSGDSDAALLAISILLQGELSEGSFLALLADFSQKLKESGVWDNKTMKAEMADWASSADLAAIRGNIAGWGLSESVPDFEKYIRGYAEANSPKGGCIGLDSGNEFCHNGHAYPKCGDENGLGKYEYNPDTQFCSANNYTVAKCGGKVYEPPGEVCNIGVVGKMCGANWYNPSENYCLNNIPYSCDNKPYNPQTQFCNLAKIYDKCGGTVTFAPGTEACCGNGKYNIANQFCFANTFYNKCGGNEYNPDTHFCLNNTITQLCGNKPYNPPTQFCFANIFYNKCGGNEYNPDTHFCLSNTITQLCGDQLFTGSQFCSGSTVYNKCGGTVTFAPETEDCCGSGKYTVTTQFCSGSTVYNKCSGSDYNPSTQYCSNGTTKTYGSISYSGQTYKTVAIGTQTWMAENLNYNASGSRCYDDLESNCNTYGRLYNWSTAMGLSSNCNSGSCSNQIQYNHKGVCPDDWHLPSNEEWAALTNFVSGIATKLKATSGWNDYNGASGNGTDDYGFSALPGGTGGTINGFGNAGSGVWWSTTEDGSMAYSLFVTYINDDLRRNYFLKSQLFSVRCLQD